MLSDFREQPNEEIKRTARLNIGLIAKSGSRKDGGRYDVARKHSFGNEYQRMDGETNPQTRRIVRLTPCEEATYLQNEQKSEVEVCEIAPDVDVVEIGKSTFQRRIKIQSVLV